MVLFLFDAAVPDAGDDINAAFGTGLEREEGTDAHGHVHVRHGNSWVGWAQLGGLLLHHPTYNTLLPLIACCGYVGFKVGRRYRMVS